MVHIPLSVVEVEVLLYVHRNRRLIRDGSPGRPPRLPHSSWVLSFSVESLRVKYMGLKTSKRPLLCSVAASESESYF